MNQPLAATPLADRKPSFFTSFRRHQIANAISAALDFGVMIALVEFVKVWYVAATACGALAGAIANFTLGRYWSFQANHRGKFHSQAMKYSIVSGTSLLLNSAGVFVFKEYAGMGYLLSRIITALLVSLLFNFPLQRVFVFR